MGKAYNKLFPASRQAARGTRVAAAPFECFVPCGCVCLVIISTTGIRGEGQKNGLKALGAAEERRPD